MVKKISVCFSSSHDRFIIYLKNKWKILKPNSKSSGVIQFIITFELKSLPKAKNTHVYIDIPSFYHYFIYSHGLQFLFMKCKIFHFIFVVKIIQQMIFFFK